MHMVAPQEFRGRIKFHAKRAFHRVATKIYSKKKRSLEDFKGDFCLNLEEFLLKNEDKKRILEDP